MQREKIVSMLKRIIIALTIACFALAETKATPKYIFLFIGDSMGPVSYTHLGDISNARSKVITLLHEINGTNNNSYMELVNHLIREVGLLLLHRSKHGVEIVRQVEFFIFQFYRAGFQFGQIKNIADQFQ